MRKRRRKIGRERRRGRGREKGEEARDDEEDFFEVTRKRNKQCYKTSRTKFQIVFTGSLDSEMCPLKS